MNFIFHKQEPFDQMDQFATRGTEATGVVGVHVEIDAEAELEVPEGL